MRRLIIRCVWFALPLLIAGIGLEWALRRIPNDYLFKKTFLEKHGDSLEVLILGSSHSLYDINPVYIKRKSFNMGEIGQTADLDWDLLKANAGYIQNIELIIMPVSYFTFYSRLAHTNAPSKIKNYNIYYKLSETYYPDEHFEMLSNSGKVNSKRLYRYYFLDSDDIRCNKLGWGNDYHVITEEKDMSKMAIRALKIHNFFIKKDTEMIAAKLDSLLNFCAKRSISVIFYTPPAHRAYRALLDQNRLTNIYRKVNELVSKYKNVSYYNYLSDSSFSSQDFFDPDHLNETGARKLTMKLDSAITELLEK